MCEPLLREVRVLVLALCIDLMAEAPTCQRADVK